MIKNIMQNNKFDTTKNLFTFDIFDTLITRVVAEPTGIFVIMQEYLNKSNNFEDLPSYLKQNFYDIRTNTEYFVRANYFINLGVQDIKLIDVYKRIQNNYNLSEAQTNALLKLEYTLEKQNLIPIKKNVDYLKKLIVQGEKVALISDMYLSEETIRDILKNIDPIFDKIPIFVSSETNKCKQSGDLYRLIQKLYNVKYGNWQHIGDNSYADYLVAKKLGIRSIKYDFVNLTSYEEKLLEKNHNDINSQIYIGISKLCRLFSEDNSAVYKLGSSFASPILYSYVNWILTTAVNEKIDNLYFVARDGYVLKTIADIIIKNKNMQIKTNYIYGSRKVFKLPLECNYKQYITEMFNEYEERFTLDFIAERLKIDTQQIKHFATNFKNFKNNKLLNRMQMRNLKDTLLDSDGFKKHVLLANKKKVDILKEYLLQEIDFNSKFAFVDVCGTSRTQNRLQDIINTIQNKTITMFYLHNDACMSLDNCSTKRTYLPTDMPWPYFIELICRHTEGQTIDYKRENNKIVPILEYRENQNLIEWGYNSFLKGITDFTNYMSCYELKNNLNLYSVNQFKFYYQTLVDKKNKELADILGKIPYLIIGDESIKCEAGRKYNFIDIIKQPRDIDFPFLSEARSGKLIVEFLNLCQKYGSIRKILIHIDINRKKKVFRLTILGFRISLSKLIW